MCIKDEINHYYFVETAKVERYHILQKIKNRQYLSASENKVPNSKNIPKQSILDFMPTSIFHKT